MTKNAKIAISVVAAVLIIDQVFKIWIKTHFMLGEEVEVLGSWFRLHFVENNGMAFGMQISGHSWGKLALSIFRLVAVGLIGYYLYKICKRKGGVGLVACVSLILAGAVGNIIDSVFYGVLFSSSVGQVAEFLPADGGYGSWLQGRVVDMLFFPLIDTRWPDWVPFFGGDHLLFFRPVFNIADSAICCGIAALILFQREALSRDLGQNTDQKEVNTAPNVVANNKVEKSE